jgi:predicted kinase
VGAVLIVFAGLPGTGKTALARPVADRVGATFLRVDSIESAIASTLAPVDDSPVGYVVAERVAADQLRGGRPVVIDAVNNVAEARDMWVALAVACAVPVRFVEVICSDESEHRRRVESRTAEMPGHAVPTWDEVQRRPWTPFTAERLLVDNVGDCDAHVAAILAYVT